MRAAPEVERGPRRSAKAAAARAPIVQRQRPALQVHCPGVVESRVGEVRRPAPRRLAETPRVVEGRRGDASVPVKRTIALDLEAGPRLVVEDPGVDTLDHPRPAP